MRHLTLCMAVVLVLAVGVPAEATSITCRDEYRPSNDLVLGALDADKGYQIGQEFQLNLLYQAGIDPAHVDAFNDYAYPTGLNFPDHEYYYLKVDAAGALPIGIWPGSDPQEYGPDSGQPWVQWTLSGWWSGKFHTILAGDITTLGGDSYLHVTPPGAYRPFPWDEFVNNIEVFTGYPIDCEVLGYKYAGDLAEGNVLSPELVPEPLTMMGVFLGVAGLGGYLRRRRTA